MNPDQRMDLEEDETFKAIRRRFYKLGSGRREKILAQMGYSRPPNLNNWREIQDAERHALFEIAAEGNLESIIKLIETQEREIESEKEQSAPG